MGNKSFLTFLPPDQSLSSLNTVSKQLYFFTLFAVGCHRAQALRTSPGYEDWLQYLNQIVTESSYSIEFLSYPPYFSAFLFQHPLDPLPWMLHVPPQICHVLQFVQCVSSFFMEQELYFLAFVLLRSNPGYQATSNKGW